MNLLHKKSILECTELEERIHQVETNQLLQKIFFPLREEDMAHQQNTGMWPSWKKSTQMAHSLSPKPTIMAIQTTPSVNYLGWIVA